MSKSKLALDMKINNITYWIDSTIVLGWLQRNPNSIEIFISNRVTEVQEITKIDDWRHVPTSHNPADCLTHRIAPNKIECSEIWWSGPEFLHKGEEHCPSLVKPEVNLPGLKPVVLIQTKKEILGDYIFKSYSEFSRLV